MTNRRKSAVPDRYVAAVEPVIAASSPPAARAGRRGPAMYALVVAAVTVLGHVSGGWGHHVSATAYVAAYAMTFPLSVFLVPLGWFTFFLLGADWPLAVAQTLMFAAVAYLQARVVAGWVRRRRTNHGKGDTGGRRPPAHGSQRVGH